jgi:hypothetical protein
MSIMRSIHKTLLAASGLALAVTTAVTRSLPTSTAAYTTIGGSLGLAQRDFRVFNSFADAASNNNTTTHPNFPGHAGAVMAIWKGTVEWASGPYAGNGLGDGVGSNPNLGDGGANFDSTFQGTHTSAGGNNGNIHSARPDSNGSTVAWMIGPISDGWKIEYFDQFFTFHDGPNNVTSGIDIQGVACHEFGHALGLGHTNVSGSTMVASIIGTGVGFRSIAADDKNGVQAIYGVKSGTKPQINSLSGSKSIGGVLVINGSNFSNSNNQVWFTAVGSNGTPAKVTGVSSTGGGTQISVTIPAGVEDGEVLVQKNASGNSALSNAFPIDIGAPAGDPPDITSINPTQGPAGGFTEVTLSGSGFTGVNVVKFGTQDALSFTVDSGSQITATAPSGTPFTFVDVTVTDPEGTDTLPSAYFYVADPVPAIDTVTPNSGGTGGGTQVQITGGSVLGVTDVTFGGVSGTGLSIVDATTLSVVTPSGSAGPVDVTAFGNGSSTIVGGFTFVDQGQFVDIGPGVGGGLGPPVQSGSGDLSPGSQQGFTVTTSNGLAFVSATMFVALGPGGAVPFKGGTFYPLPILLQIPLQTDIFGEINLQGVIPVGTPPGTEIVFQTWLTDITSPAGVSGTNGLKAITP